MNTPKLLIVICEKKIQRPRTEKQTKEDLNVNEKKQQEHNSNFRRICVKNRFLPKRFVWHFTIC